MEYSEPDANVTSELRWRMSSRFPIWAGNAWQCRCLREVFVQSFLSYPHPTQNCLLSRIIRELNPKITIIDKKKMWYSRWGNYIDLWERNLYFRIFPYGWKGKVEILTTPNHPRRFVEQVENLNHWKSWWNILNIFFKKSLGHLGIKNFPNRNIL